MKVVTGLRDTGKVQGSPRGTVLASGQGFVALAVAILMAGCGGSGGGEEAAVADPPARAASAGGSPDAVDVTRTLVVMLKPGFALQPLLERHSLQQVSQFGRRPIFRLLAASSAEADVAVGALLGETSVQFAERDLEVASPESRRFSPWTVGSAGAGLGAQYASELLALPAAHAVSQGAGVRVAVLDSGIDLTHPALAPHLARNAAGQVLGRDFVDDDATPAEAGGPGDAGWGHGTHVAGLVMVAAPQAKLMPVRVLDKAGLGNAWVLAEALAWAVDPDGNPATDDGAHVINLSIGSTTPTRLLTLVTKLASCELEDDDDGTGDEGFDDDRTRCAAGGRAVVVSAAGNSGSDNELLYPAAEPVKGALAVTAGTQRRTLAPFANWGSWIQLAAPGENLLSTVPGGGYGTWSGTSMAAPLVAGTAALVLATLPPSGDASRPSPRQWLPEFVVKRLTDRPVKMCGTSFLQVHALAAVMDTPAPDPACP